mmetsp:Transcript_6850/g.28615  ORF Transcript_6850/g.28615 Transcript_6850/m.28615 type:complete len:152 (-) Transcript_6850:1646-2101(-)
MTWLSCLQQDLNIASRMPRPVVKRVEMDELMSLRSHGGVDRALLSFDMAADLRPAFHWNLKQLFVFVLAEYRSKTNVLNQVILWDKIVEDEHDASLREDQKYVKYALYDQTNELRNTTVTLSLVWDHMPVTGRLFMDRDAGGDFTLPGKYF